MVATQAKSADFNISTTLVVKAALACCLFLLAFSAILGSIRIQVQECLVVGYTLIEAAFVLVYWQKHKQVNQQPACHEPAGHDPKPVIKSFLRHLTQVESPQDYLSPWFLGAPMASIKRGNVEEMFAYAFWYRSL